MMTHLGFGDFQVCVFVCVYILYVYVCVCARVRVRVCILCVLYNNTVIGLPYLMLQPWLTNLIEMHQSGEHCQSKLWTARELFHLVRSVAPLITCTLKAATGSLAPSGVTCQQGRGGAC